MGGKIELLRRVRPFGRHGRPCRASCLHIYYKIGDDGGREVRPKEAGRSESAGVLVVKFSITGILARSAAVQNTPSKPSERGLFVHRASLCGTTDSIEAMFDMRCQVS